MTLSVVKVTTEDSDSYLDPIQRNEADMSTARVYMDTPADHMIEWFEKLRWSFIWHCCFCEETGDAYGQTEWSDC